MEYNRIIAITGMPGLFELVSSKTDGAIVKNLDDKSVKFVSSRVHNFSHLESIEVYTIRENVNLLDVLKAMEASTEAIPADKDGAAVKSYLQKVYADLDFERVYVSDMKKMIKWYGILKANEVELKSTAASEETDTEEAENDAEPVAIAETAAEETQEAAPKKAASKKKMATPEIPYDTPSGSGVVHADNSESKEGTL